MTVKQLRNLVIAITIGVVISSIGLAIQGYNVAVGAGVLSWWLVVLQIIAFGIQLYFGRKVVLAWREAKTIRYFVNGLIKRDVQ